MNYWGLGHWLTDQWRCSFNKDQGVLILCTDSFTPVEVDLLRSILLENFNIESTRVSAGNKGKDQYRIRIPKRAVSKLQSLVGNICRLQCDTVLGFKALALQIRLHQDSLNSP
jgi:hypothetical protein